MGLVFLLGIYRAFAQTVPGPGLLTLGSVISSGVELRTPELPIEATFCASVTTAVPAPPTANPQVWLQTDAVQGAADNFLLGN